MFARISQLLLTILFGLALVACGGCQNSGTATTQPNLAPPTTTISPQQLYQDAQVSLGVAELAADIYIDFGGVKNASTVTKINAGFQLASSALAVLDNDLSNGGATFNTDLATFQQDLLTYKAAITAARTAVTAASQPST
jgi:hypothetical protein